VGKVCGLLFTWSKRSSATRRSGGGRLEKSEMRDRIVGKKHRATLVIWNNAGAWPWTIVQQKKTLPRSPSDKGGDGLEALGSIGVITCMMKREQEGELSARSTTRRGQRGGAQMDVGHGVISHSYQGHPGREKLIRTCSLKICLK